MKRFIVTILMVVAFLFSTAAFVPAAHAEGLPDILNPTYGSTFEGSFDGPVVIDFANMSGGNVFYSDRTCGQYDVSYAPTGASYAVALARLEVCDNDPQT
jgi:hypothetical protein